MEIRGDGRVEEMCSAATSCAPPRTAGSARTTPASARSCGPAWCCARSATGASLDGLPFDERRGVIPNAQGGSTAPSGSTSSAGSSAGRRGSSARTRRTRRRRSPELLADLDSGALRRHDRDRHDRDEGTAGDGRSLARERQPDLVTEQGWQLIDAAERAAGEPHGRPRVKLCRTDALLDIALNRATTATV